MAATCTEVNGKQTRWERRQQSRETSDCTVSPRKMGKLICDIQSVHRDVALSCKQKLEPVSREWQEETRGRGISESVVAITLYAWLGSFRNSFIWTQTYL